MPLSPRLLLATAVLASLSVAAVIHLVPHAGPQAGRTLFVAPAPPPSPAPLLIPNPSARPRPGWLPPVLRSPGGLWERLNRDTATTTRGQIRLVQLIEDTVRDQVRNLLQHPLGGV